MLFLLLAQTLVTAQTDSLLQLPTVEVTATSLRNEYPGGITETWNDAAIAAASNQSVADFLRSKTGIYVKSYGAGSLATTSIRGASAGQTAVLWNGFQIQSPMLGLLDWSLLPTYFADEISLQHGGNSAIWGSGAIGGAVLLENSANFDSKQILKISVAHGSFGQWNGHASAKFANQHWASSTRIFHQQAKNDFSYVPSPGLPTKYQTNSAMRQSGLMQELYWRPNSRHQIGLKAWLQSAYREIPPTTTQTRSVANQADNAVRAALHWRFAMGQQLFQVRTALFRESIHYKDKLAGTNTPSHFWTSITEADWQRPITQRLRLQIAGNQTFTKAFIKNYASSAERLQSAFFGSLRYSDEHWNAQLDGRQEWINGRAVPFTPSISGERKLGKLLKIGAKLGRNYRLPTLNDLFWSPGGNPEMQAESGWSEELNAHFTLKKNKVSVQFSTAIFNRNIKNWIQWLPTEGKPYWSASNIKAVWSRGIENRMHGAWDIADWHLGLGAGYDLIRSTSQESVILPKIEAGQQWFYVPENQAFASGSVRFKEIGLQYHHQFTGAVVTEFGSLKGYEVGTVVLDFSGNIWKTPTRFFLQIDNCWDTNYRLIERRPMPGRAWLVGTSISFTKN